jgi:23S rRNA (guanosine2251-2'-O)-methyltransferase
MPAQPPKQPTKRYGAKPGAKPGATREQTERRERFERARRESLRGADEGPVVIYGWHSVTAALRNPARNIRKLLATENAARRLSDEGVTAKPEIVRPSAIAERLLPDAVHQGLYLETDPLPSPAIEAVPATGAVLVLDQITDPHNVGAIFRSAAAFGATAIVTTQRHSPDATGALAKAASGALELVPLVNVQNLARALDALKASGFLVVGLDSSGEADLAALTLRAPLALVLGAEGKGLRQLTKATCDHVARIDLPGEIKSLNVSNAAALSLYVASRQSKGA